MCLALYYFDTYGIDDEATAIELIRKFEDDTKGAKVIKIKDDADKLQQCLDKLYDWSKK